MIFGFNTDIRQDETVYHVQSEVRMNERRLETQVFVRGRCIGKCTNAMSDGTDSEQELHEKLRTQHRQALEAIREGRLDTFLADAPNADIPIRVDWVGADVERAQNTMLLRFQVNQPSAHVSAWAENAAEPAAGSEADTNADGEVVLRLPLILDAGVIVVQVNAGNRTLTQKFRLVRD